MHIHSFSLVIDNFDNAAMADNPSSEVIRILTELITQITEYGIPNADGKRLKDTNGNTVGSVLVDFD
jgi:hypothetical protein